MALSQDIIFYQLAQKYDSVFCLRDKNLPECYTTALFEAERDLSNHAVIISSLDFDALDVHHAFYTNCLFVCLGAPRKITAAQGLSLIAVEENANIASLLNELNRIFLLYANWTETLNSILAHENGSFQEMLECSEFLFADALCIHDTEFHFVAYGKLSDQKGFSAKYVNPDQSFTIEVANEYMTDLQYAAKDQQQEAFFHSFTIGDSVNKNLFCEGNNIGKIVAHVDEIDESKFRYYSAGFSLLAQYVEALYARNNSFNQNNDSINNFTELLIDSLDGKNILSDYLDKLLFEMGWEQGDVYLLVQVKPTPRNIKEMHARFIMAEMARSWQGYVGIEYGEEMLVLINTTRFSSQHERGFLQALSVFLRDNLLTAGVSRSFTDLKKMQAAHTQTNIAFEFGTQAQPMQWYHQFDDFALAYMLENSRGGFAPDDICNTKLLALKEYDAEKGTELCITLSTYIECHFNAVATAQKLFIQRSSLLYRLKRIEEIAHIDMDSVDELLYISLSMRVLGQELLFFP